MGTRILARYEDKVLKPVEDLDLEDGELVELQIFESATRKILGLVGYWEGVDEVLDHYETYLH